MPNFVFIYTGGYNLSGIAGVLSSLSSSDMTKKFAEHRIRFENGRVNEIMNYEVDGYLPSVYSEMISSLDVSYRYWVKSS